MANKSDNIRKNIARILVGVLAFIFILPLAHANFLNASIIDAGTSLPTNMSYESTTLKAYIDNAAGNPDVTLKVCADNSAEISGQYGGFVYKAGSYIDDTSTFRRVAGMPTTELGVFGNCDSKCCKVSANLNFLSDYAVYPAQVYGVVSGDDTVDIGDTFIQISTASWLNGEYGFNNYGYGDIDSLLHGYDAGTGNLNVTVTAIQGYNYDDANWYEIWSSTVKVNKTMLVMAVCDATGGLTGYVCQDGTLTYPDKSVLLSTGIINPPETSTATEYFVVNGIGTSFCIGADLKATYIDLTPQIVYQSQNITFNATITNNGNVDVTSSFNVSFSYDGNFIANVTVNGLDVGEIKYASYIWHTTGVSSGTYDVTATIYGGSIGDCDDTNNVAISSAMISKTYNMTVYINGTKTNTFARAGMPYNVTVVAEDSDGNFPNNYTLKITEKNGLNLFAPSQGWLNGANENGVIALSVAETYTNSTGGVSLALLPMGNKLFTAGYAYLNATDYIGNYSIYIELYNGATKLQLYDPTTDSLISQYDLTLSDHSVVDPTSAQENSLYVFNHNSWVTAIINFMVQTFGSIQKWIHP